MLWCTIALDADGAMIVAGHFDGTRSAGVSADGKLAVLSQLRRMKGEHDMLLGHARFEDVKP